MKKKGIVKNKFDVFDFFSRNSSVYVGVKKNFVDKIRTSIIDDYKTLRSFNQNFLKINYPTLKHDFQKAQYHSLVRWLSILGLFNINREEFFENIICFRLNGSHSKSAVILPRILALDEKFMEGYSLYLAEGDTGLSGKKVPAKLRFTNANPDVIKFFISWFKCYFPNNNFYVNAIIPNGASAGVDFLVRTGEKLDIPINAIKVTHDYYNKIIK